jgi:NodT family efflux transporter outer membrane factor (OMF) lipoprotein
VKRLALLFALSIAGCASERGITHRSTPVDAAALQVEKSLGAQSASGEWPALDWWKRFGDPQLDALIDEALAGSPTLRLARARLDQARAQAQIARAPLGPQANAEASVNRQRFSENYIFPPPIGGSSYTTTQLDLNASYDVDFWGRNRAAYEAAVGRARAAQAESFAARLVLSSSVASVYVQLARGYDQLDIARHTLEDRERVQSLTSDRLRAGLDSRLELKQVETSIPAARARSRKRRKTSTSKKN